MRPPAMLRMSEGKNLSCHAKIRYPPPTRSREMEVAETPTFQFKWSETAFRVSDRPSDRTN